MAGRTYAPIRIKDRHSNRVKSTVPGAPKDPTRYLKDRARLEMLEEIEVKNRKEAETRSKREETPRSKAYKGKMNMGGKVMKYNEGGCVGDGCAIRGRTKGTMR